MALHIFEKRFFRYLYLRLVRQRGTPENIAASVAIGIFLGLLVPMGAQMLVVLVVAFFLKCNKLIACSCTFITNPATVLPIYTFLFYLGSYITGIDIGDKFSFLMSNLKEMDAWKNLGIDGLIVFFVGASLVGFIFASISYVLTLRFIITFRAQKELKKIQKLEKKREHKIQTEKE